MKWKKNTLYDVILYHVCMNVGYVCMHAWKYVFMCILNYLPYKQYLIDIFALMTSKTES